MVSNRVKAAIAEGYRYRAERKVAGLTDDRPCPFEAYENERTGAMISRQIEAEHGTFANFMAETDRELAGQVPRTAAEMIEHLRRVCLKED